MAETIFTRPKFITQDPPNSYYQPQNPYVNAPSCHVSLLKLTRYARQEGKRIVDLTAEEVEQFRI